LSFWFIPKLISVSEGDDALLAISMQATATVLAVPSPPGAAGHPCSPLQQEPLVGPGTRPPSARSLMAPALQPRSPKQEVGEICNREGRVKGK